MLKNNEEILTIIEKPDFGELSHKEKHLLWKYRYSLKNDERYRKGIVKFLLSVDWERRKEKNEALEMLNEWEIDLEHAVPMLSALFSSNETYPPIIKPDCCDQIRKKAVKRLYDEDTSSIQLILLQLVQAYRYEDFNQTMLRDFFMSKVTQNKSIAHSFYWIAKLEKENDKSLPDIREQYEFLVEKFLAQLSQDDPEVGHSLKEQLAFREKLHAVSSHVSKIKGVSEKKEELQKVLKEGGEFDMTYFDPTPMPLDPEVQVCGVIPSRCSVFPSAMCPLKLTFKVTEHTQSLGLPSVDKGLYNVMYKVGDDVRQDQLVLQMVDLMDFLLKKINYDFKFTVYKVLAFTPEDGLVEFVPRCKTISEILHDYGSKIDKFLTEWSKHTKTDYGTVFETYLDSWAGYWVVTYLLAVGDRHLENLLIDQNGRMFHVDFGFIFGKNPPRKGIMPPIRICSEMIDCMGGFGSPNYQRFLDKCVTAFKFLRNHSKYILNLCYLMIHSEIEDLPADNSEEILNQMYQKFLPDIKESSEVDIQFKKLIEESITAFFAKVFDRIHDIAQMIK